MSHPNIFVTPTIRPPFPAWDPAYAYVAGDVVSYAQQNWICFVVGLGTETVVGKVPDQNQICQNGKGVLCPTTAAAPLAYNPTGGCWHNLTLASPPAMPWSPSLEYQPGTTVAYPPGQPGKYWVSRQVSFNETPVNNASTQPNNVPYNIGVGKVTSISADPQYWIPAAKLTGTPASDTGPPPAPQPPPAPTNVSITNNGQLFTSLTLAWTSPVMYQSFRVSSSNGFSEVIPGYSTFFVFDNLDPDAAYQFSVQGFSTVGDSPVVTVSGFTATAPRLLSFTATPTVAPGTISFTFTYNPIVPYESVLIGSPGLPLPLTVPIGIQQPFVLAGFPVSQGPHIVSANGQLPNGGGSPTVEATYVNP
jgi:hypothetical protein